MQSIAQLNDSFSLPGRLTFDEPAPGMPRARITTPACTAELYLQGAQLTAWQPATATAPVLYLSPTSEIAPGKAIRGGVPVIFPWFGGRTPEIAGTAAYDAAAPQPAHGFARTAAWTLAFAALAGNPDAPDTALHLTLTLAPTAASRTCGFDAFACVLEFTLGLSAAIKMTVVNQAAAPLVFEQALHTYLAVADVRHATIAGLGDTAYIDKTDNFARKRSPAGPLTLTATTDRPYLNTDTTVTVADSARTLTVAKSGSATTVVWNPWRPLADAADWQRFVCIEAANAADNRITLQPGEAHVMTTHLSLPEA